MIAVDGGGGVDAERVLHVNGRRSRLAFFSRPLAFDCVASLVAVLEVDEDLEDFVLPAA